MRRLALLFFFISLTACGKSTPPPATDEATRRATVAGDVVGFVTDDGAHAWRGLPYAAAPVATLRWRAPQPPEPWEGVRDAAEFADRCLQISNRLNASEGVEPGEILGAEDCLYLDIYAPPDAPGKDLPVMVWIHGGANVWGRSSSYEGSRLALNEDVIVVAVQYRLGPFGFFSHELLRESAAAPEDGAANFAVLDLVASLEWVRDNISNFGGDPGRVTIFGESAGGHNVAALLAAPQAARLFHRAIIQSGSFDSVSRATAERDHRNASEKILSRLEVGDADALRAVAAEDLFAAYQDGAFSFLDMPTMIEDGVTLPAFPLREAFADQKTFNVVPVITGTNRDEMKFFNFADPALVKRRFFLFPVPRDPVYWDRLNHYMSRVWRILAVDQPASAMADAGHEDVYAYRFDWDESGRFFLSDFSELVGAGHSIEIPFVFNRFQFFGARYDRVFFTPKTKETRENLSRAMGGYWAEFARTGEPGAGGAPGGVQWPRWNTNGGALMRFDAETDAGDAVIFGKDTLAALAADLAADPQLNDSERCAIITAIEIWENSISDAMRTEVGCAATN